MLANQMAARLVSKPIEEVTSGISAFVPPVRAMVLSHWISGSACRTKSAMGRFDLPDGGYPQCKVRLAERPLAERNAADDDPGLEETIWIQRLSPCHGIIRSVLYQTSVSILAMRC